jgi:serine/threonine-protein kinase RsbW
VSEREARRVAWTEERAQRGTSEHATREGHAKSAPSAEREARDMATVELAFSALPVHVRTARLIVTAVARRSGVDEALLDEVRLAVGEACSRAVEAHRLHCPDQPVRLELRDENGRFEVVVNDTASNGKPVDRRAAAAAPSARPLPGDAVPSEEAAPADAARPDAVPSDGDGGEAVPGQAGRARAAAAGTVIPGDAAPIGDDPDSLGLAVISGLVDDVEIAPTSDGTQIRMGWPVATPAKR